jgi:MFS family permease
MSLRTPWARVAFVMFAVGWGANQFSPMLIVYRRELGLGPGAIDGLFAIYAATLIPGLLIGGPASDRFGRRAVVLPFAALSPVATLPHLLIGTAALAIGLTAPAPRARPGVTRSGWPPPAVRTRRFWLTIAPAAPFVFGAISLAIVVLPEEVTGARTLSAGYAGLMTVLAFAAGIGVQPAARRLAARRQQAGAIAGLAAAAIGAAAGVPAVASANRVLAGVAAVFLGLAYGLCLVSGLRQAEQLAGDRDRGAVLACYYVLAYLGFVMPYVVVGLNGTLGRPGAFAALAGGAAAVTAWLGWQARRAGGVPADESSAAQQSVSA